MTQDAITKANELLQQISAAQAEKMNHLSGAAKAFKSLPAAQLKTITDALSSIHDQIITPLQQQLTALSGDFTNPKS